MSTLFAQQQALLQQQLQVLARIESGSIATPARTAPVQLAAALPPALGIAAMRPARAESLDSRLRGNDIGVGRSPLSSMSPRTAPAFPLMPSQTARTPYFSSSRTARVFSLSSSRTARRAEPGSRQAPHKDLWMTSFAVGEAIPACAGMTAIKMSSRGARSASPGSSATPVLAAPVQLAAVQPPTAESLDSRFRGNDSGGGCSTSSSTSAQPASVFFLSSSRTARRAGTDPDAILRAVADVLDHGGKAGRVPERWDGHAAERIADDLCRWLAGGADFLAVSRTDQRSALGSA